MIVKNCLPERVATYFTERKVGTAADAAFQFFCSFRERSAAPDGFGAWGKITDVSFEIRSKKMGFLKTDSKTGNSDIIVTFVTREDIGKTVLC